MPFGTCLTFSFFIFVLDRTPNKSSCPSLPHQFLSIAAGKLRSMVSPQEGSVLLFLFSAICFAMTFFYDYENDSLASLLNYVCFGVTCLFGFNALIFSIFRLKTKFGVRG